MEPLQVAIITPLPEVGVDTLPCRILPRQHAPLTATDDDIQNAIDDRSHLQCARSASWLCRRNQVFDTIPLTVGQIGWIQLVLVHIPSVPPRLPGCHPFTNRLLAIFGKNFVIYGTAVWGFSQVAYTFVVKPAQERIDRVKIALDAQNAQGNAAMNNAVTNP